MAEKSIDTPCVFLDLDDTLFHSRRKLATLASAGVVEAGRLRSGATGPDGQTNAFMRPSQQTLCDWIFSSCRVIPTTCRSLEQFRRTEIESFDHAILYCGGMILDSDGQVDQAWDGRIREQLAETADALSRGKAIAKDTMKDRPEMLIRTCNHQGTSFFLHVKDRSGRQCGIDALVDEFSATDLGQCFNLIRQGASLALMPHCVDKRHAAEYLLESMPDRPRLTIGIGDASFDVGFMGLCDFCMMPSSSELWQSIATLNRAEVC